MSRYCAEKNTGPILDAAARWKEVALLKDGSIFTNKRLWTIEGLEALEKYFVQNLDEGEGSFIEKLIGQLAPTSPEVKQLAAEMNWVMLLCPSNTLPPKKRETIREIWQWSNEPFPETAQQWMSDEVIGGVGSAGPGFNNHRWRELAFCITLVLSFKRMPLADRQRLLKNGWEFADWLQANPGADARQFRHMLLFLLFPDDFERLFGRPERRAVASAFSGISAHDINAQNPLELDHTLRRLRKDLEIKHGKKELDYYEPPLSPLC